MSFYADLHVHSKYSRACSRDCDLEHLAWWAGRKGITVVGTGDFCHPAWADALRDGLVPAEPGLFRLRDEESVMRTLPPSCRGPVRFMLSVEISTIYKRGERTRKVHHLLYAPDFTAAERIRVALSKIGNLASDGRPILGLDSRDLLEITLEAGPGCYLVPAHVWTPWFSVLGSKSGFDAVTDCYADLAEHVFALETGLSSDPPMNWRVAALDRYTLVSNSDAHSPPALGREACAFGCAPDYFAMRRALETGEGYLGTVEFFPEEGKYHLDGHRKCGVRFRPEDTRGHGGRCPRCGRPVTVGVLHRVAELADRPEGYRPAGVAGYRNLVPLPEMVGEILGVGPKSKRVAGEVARLVAELGPELAILEDVPVEEVRRVGGELLAEAVARLRRGEVVREGGYDGEYGVIRLFRPEELRRPGAGALFDVDAPAADAAAPGRANGRPAARSASGPAERADPAALTEPADVEPAGRSDADDPCDPTPSAPDGTARGSLLDRLDPDQRAAAAVAAGPVLIVAGPGTGKTRTLTHRIAHLVAERGVDPARCLAITFTRRAAEEMRDRLGSLIPQAAPRVTVTTFHGLGVRILREQHARAGLTAAFRVADEAARLAVAGEIAGSSEAGRRLLARLDDDPETRQAYDKALRERDLVTFDDLITLPVRLLTEDPALAAHYRDRWRWVSVDEYQDVDADQYALLRLLGGCDLTVIGDPDQAIYAFRGAEVGFFLKFATDFPDATVVSLTRNYRSTPPIVTGARQAIAPTTLVPDRRLYAAVDHPEPALIGRYEAGDEADEADFVTRTIDRLLGGASFHSLDSGRVDARAEAARGGLSFADVAVLYRTDAQARPIMEALTRAGMPYQKRSHDRLTGRPGVAMLADELRHTCDGPLTERLSLAARRLAARLPEGRHDREGVDIAAAVDLLAPLARRCGHDLELFLGELALGAEVDAYDPRADRVALLTLHAAKGLEFPVVFLVGCEKGLLPLRLPGGAADPDPAEERRLFFVGMTRARQRLYLSYARRRARQGGVCETGPSPFLDAIDARLVEALGGARRARPRARQLRLI